MSVLKRADCTSFQPILFTPCFFGLALNPAAVPPLEKKVEQKAESGLTPYIKGIFGFRNAEERGFNLAQQEVPRTGPAS